MLAGAQRRARCSADGALVSTMGARGTRMPAPGKLAMRGVTDDPGRVALLFSAWTFAASFDPTHIMRAEQVDARARHEEPVMRCAERRCLGGVEPPTLLQPDQLVPTALHRTG